MDEEFKVLVLRGLSVLMSRLPYTGYAIIEREKGEWQKDAVDLIERLQKPHKPFPHCPV